MQIRFTKSRWEYGDVPVQDFLDRVVADGFEGVELFALRSPLEPERVREEVQKRNLFLIAQLINLGDNVEECLESYDVQLQMAKNCGALFINCHTGSDFFSFEDNLRLFRHAEEWSRANRMPLYHETHRGRALCTLPETLRYLEALPDLHITADFSHFMCVHESTLEAQDALLDQVIARTRHIHARVGFPEGPQVGHPLAPESAELLQRYLYLWKKILAAMEKTGATSATITPEAGPPGYMPVLPFTNLPVADAWTVNVQMKDWLKTRV